jgi:hypothetical protein
MANGLVTTAQFPGLVPDIGALGRGFSSGLQAKRGLQQLRAGEQDLAAKEEDRLARSIVNGALQTKLIPTVQGKIDFLEKRGQEILGRGGTPDDNQVVLDLYKSGKVQEGDALLDRAIDVGRQMGILKSLPGDKPVEAITPEGDLKFVPAREAVSKGLAPAGSTFRKQELEARDKERVLQEQTNRLRRIELTTKLNTQEREKVTEKLKTESKRREKIFKSRQTIEKVNLALEQTGILSTGVIGQLTGFLGGTPAAKLKGTTETLVAQLRFDQIQKMKDDSPTGATGLGQIAIPEFTALGVAYTNLDPNQGPDQLRKNLEEVSFRARRVNAIVQSEETIQNMVDKQFDEYVSERGTADGFKFDINEVVIKNHRKFGEVTIAEIYKAAIKNGIPYEEMLAKLGGQ